MEKSDPDAGETLRATDPLTANSGDAYTRAALADPESTP
jgi:hypothetical protein